MCALFGMAQQITKSRRESQGRILRKLLFLSKGRAKLVEKLLQSLDVPTQKEIENAQGKVLGYEKFDLDFLRIILHIVATQL
jgi:hypothetical protein